MRRLLTIALMLIAGTISAQFRASHSQYMHNQQLFNPAYNDVSVDIGGTAFYRNQWPTMEGGPVSQIANIFYNRADHNFNLTFLNDKITVFKHMEIGLAYNYKLYLGYNTTWSFGMKASYNMQVANYDGLVLFDGGDPVLSGSQTTNGFNFGAGTFFQNENWFAGFAANNLFKNLAPPRPNWGLQDQHYTITGGWRMMDRKSFTVFPTGIIKFVSGAPIHLGIDFNAMIMGQFWASLGYRIDHTAILSAGYVFLDKIKIVYSYDLPVTGRNWGLRGAHELSIGYGMSLFQNDFQRRKYLTNGGGFKKTFKRKGKDKGPEDKPGKD